MTLKAYQYSISPNTEQQFQLWQHFNHNRGVWNRMLALKSRYYRMFGKSLSKRQLQDHLIKLKKRPAFAWLKQVNSQSLLATLNHLDTAYSNFFKGIAKFPRFKSKCSNWHSYANPQHTEVDFDSGKVKLPKIGWVKAKLHREFVGKVKTSTVKISPSGKFTVSILVDDGKVLPDAIIIEPEYAIGIDLGIKDFVITSRGKTYENKRLLDKQLHQLNKLQRILSRKKKGSASRNKQRIKVAKLHEHVANSRKDYAHKVSAELVSESQTTIFCEDLAVKNLLRNKKLSRHIANIGWSQFLNFLSYKMKESSKNLIRINRFKPSSRECRICHSKHENLKLSDRNFECPYCGHTEDRDIHAAKNILRFGLEQELGSGSGSRHAVKSTPESILDLTSGSAKGLELALVGSAEAPSRIALAI